MRVSGSEEGVEVSRASAITVTFGFDDPASNSSPRLQIFFTQFRDICLSSSSQQEPVGRNSSKDLVGSIWDLSFFSFSGKCWDKLRMMQGNGELIGYPIFRSSYN